MSLESFILLIIVIIANHFHYKNGNTLALISMVVLSTVQPQWIHSPVKPDEERTPSFHTVQKDREYLGNQTGP